MAVRTPAVTVAGSSAAPECCRCRRAPAAAPQDLQVLLSSQQNLANKFLANQNITFGKKIAFLAPPPPRGPDADKSDPMAYYGAPAQDINAKYNTANAELNQLYTLATSALPVAPDAVIQALITCRMALTGLMPGQAQPMPVLSMAPPPEPDPMAVPPPPQQLQMPPQQQQMGEQQMYAPQQQMYAPQMGGMSYHPSAMSGHVHGGGPPPPPPAVLMPQGTYHAPPPPPAEQANFTRRADNWPPRSYHKSLGEAIHQAQEVRHRGLEPQTSRGSQAALLLTRLSPRLAQCPGHVRHEIIIEKRCIGRILGKGGRDLAAMKEGSGAEVFIIDKARTPWLG